jgi:ATP-dependent DNA helicase RecG
MVNLNLIDTQGGGIKKMFQKQRSRFFPMPDYDLSQPERVAVKIGGRILDERYAQLLMNRMDLGLESIILLDRVQKRQPITREEHQTLKRDGLVEGRFPNLVVAAQIAAITGEKAKHIRDKGFNNEYYRDLIVKIIREMQPVSREDIDQALLNKLPEILTQEQKLEKIHNLLTVLSRKEQKIRNVGGRRYSRWIVNDGEKAEPKKTKENQSPES